MKVIILFVLQKHYRKTNCQGTRLPINTQSDYASVLRYFSFIMFMLVSNLYIFFVLKSIFFERLNSHYNGAPKNLSLFFSSSKSNDPQNLLPIVIRPTKFAFHYNSFLNLKPLENGGSNAEENKKMGTNIAGNHG